MPSRESCKFVYFLNWQGVLHFSSGIMESEHFWPLVKLSKLPQTHAQLLHFHSSDVFKVLCEAATRGNKRALDITTLIGDTFFADSVKTAAADSNAFVKSVSNLQYPAA